MIGQLVGACHKKGTFVNEESGECIAYDNLSLTILVPVKVGGQYEPIEGIGMIVEKKAQCPFAFLSDVFGDEYQSLNDIEPLLGREIEFFYDGSKKLARVLIHE